MQIYRGKLELLDYVFYATTERGLTHETGEFIHNYALTYALGLAQGARYTNLVQKPRYKEELTSLNGRLYITPAAPERVAYSTIQWNTLNESYTISGKERSIGYPDWGFAHMLRPGSRFIFYVLIQDQNLPAAPTLGYLLQGKPVYVRLGKFMAKSRVELSPADQVVMRKSAFRSDAYLNWQDLPVDPEFCDVVIASRPTRLIKRSQFPEWPHYEAHFGGDVVRLPEGMCFVLRLSSRQAARKASSGQKRGTLETEPST